MNGKDNSAFPRIFGEESKGLTKKELVSAILLAGMLASGARGIDRYVVRAAIEYTDLWFEEMSNETQNKRS